jgi:hypothetical protein
LSEEIDDRAGEEGSARRRCRKEIEAQRKAPDG